MTGSQALNNLSKEEMIDIIEIQGKNLILANAVINQIPKVAELKDDLKYKRAMGWVAFQAENEKIQSKLNAFKPIKENGNVPFPEVEKASSHFRGIVEEEIEKKYGKDIKVEGNLYLCEKGGLHNLKDITHDRLSGSGIKSLICTKCDMMVVFGKGI